MEYFEQQDIQRLFHDKFVVVIGDSVQRGVYKDLVRLLTDGEFLSVHDLKAKGEIRFCRDDRIEWTGRTAGKYYREVRQYQSAHYLIRFYFVTRCYSEYMETVIRDFSKDLMPDVLIMNSCLWDISRYGPDGKDSYKHNLQKIFTRFSDTLSQHCLFIWLTALPVAGHITAPLLPPHLSFLEEVLSLEVRQANYMACKMAQAYELDIIDLHYYFQNDIHMRENDGIHWNKYGHRRITNRILMHICEAWDVLPPSAFKQYRMDKRKRSSPGPDEELYRRRCFKLPRLVSYF